MLKKCQCRFRLFVLVVGVLLTVLGCEVEEGEIVLGSLLALTGEHQSNGINQQRGMDIAVEEINSAGGIGGLPIRIVYADTRMDDTLALQEYKRLTLGEGVEVIVGVTGSGVALHLALRANSDKVVLLDSIDTSPRLTEEGGAYFFRNIASESYSAEVLTKWALDRYKQAALIYNSDNVWATGCRKAVEAAYKRKGGKFVVEPIVVVNSTNDFTSPITVIRQAPQSSQVIFVCLMGRQGGLFVAQAVANGIEAPFYGLDQFSPQEFINNAKNAVSKSYFVMPQEGRNEKQQQFGSKYQELYGAYPDSVAGKAYDSVYLLSKALRIVKQDGSKITGAAVRDALADVSFNGVTGHNAFDKNGDLLEALFDRFTYREKQRVRAE